MTAQGSSLDEYFVYQINLECALRTKEGKPVSEGSGVGGESQRTDPLGVLGDDADLRHLLTVGWGITHRPDGHGLSQKEL